MKRLGWARSAFICLTVLALLTAAGFALISGEDGAVIVSSKVEAALNGTGAQSEPEPDKQSDEQAAETEESSAEGEDGSKDDTGGKDSDSSGDEVEQLGNVSEDSNRDEADAEVEDEKAEEESDQTGQESGDDYTGKQTQSLPVETNQEDPDAVPQTEAAVETVEAVEPQEEEAPEPEPEPEPAPSVSYSWGGTSNYTFRMEVEVSNIGSNTSRNVRVSVPLLENTSPYQTTTLRSVNYSSVSTSGRVHTFNIGDLPPGQTKTIVAEFDIAVRTVSINSSNETVEKARQAYNQYAGSGNCRTLARGFISKARELGIQAREVIGFARPQRGPMTSGSLAGTRHSWAEFYVDGLGWVPVDLTFQYFGELPHPSHIVESYSDQSIRVNYTGGSLSATWSNAIR